MAGLEPNTKKGLGQLTSASCKNGANPITYLYTRFRMYQRFDLIWSITVHLCRELLGPTEKNDPLCPRTQALLTAKSWLLDWVQIFTSDDVERSSSHIRLHLRRRPNSSWLVGEYCP